MAISRVTPNELPPRHWALVAFPTDGKSTFAMRMKGLIGVADIDGRIAEVRAFAAEDPARISLDGDADPADMEAWSEQLKKDVPGSGIKTLVVDSLTRLVNPLQAQATLDASRATGNRSAVFRDKAVLTRIFLETVHSFPKVDVLLLWHFNETQFNGANNRTQTISEKERARLRAHLNIEMEIVVDEKKNNKRGIMITWSRNGRGMGQILWDDSGSWKDMPEKVEQLVYNTKPAAAPASAGSTGAVPQPQSQSKGEGSLPQSPVNLTSKEEAIAWSVKQEAFPDEAAATKEYEALKKQKSPKTAGDMFNLWRTRVQEIVTTRRVAA